MKPLLARVRSLLATARQEPIPPTLPREGTRGFHAVRLELDRSDLDDLLRELDAALSGIERDFGQDRETATLTVAALDPQGRFDLLVDFLAVPMSPHARTLRVARAEALRWWRLGRDPRFDPTYCAEARALWRARASLALAKLRRAA